MHGLANALMLAASLRAGALVAQGVAGADVPQMAPYDAEQWAGPVAPWSNPLDHDLLHRPKEAKDRVWAEPYMGNVPLIAIASGNPTGVVWPERIGDASLRRVQEALGVLGPTPDGRGIVRDTLFRRGREGVTMFKVDSLIGPLCTGFHIPKAEERAVDSAN